MLSNYRLMALMEASKQKSQNEGGDDDLNFEDPMADDGADFYGWHGELLYGR